MQKTLQPAYAKRYQVMMQAIEEHLLPLGVKLPQTTRNTMGGYFIWLTLPASLDAAKVASVAQAEQNLVVAAGNIFEVPGDGTAVFPHSLRLCFAWEDISHLELGVVRLAEVIRNLKA